MRALSYTILGAGALGAYYGARLMHGGCTVRFLLRGDYAHVREHGLRVESMHGDLVLPEVEAYGRPADLPPSDVAVVAMKTTHGAALSEMLPGALKPGGVVLVLQNGLEPERVAAGLVGGEHVVGGLCFLCSNRIGPGHIRQTRFDHVRLGEFETRGITPRLEAIAGDFAAGGVEAQPIADLRLARWQKLVWNIPYNGLSALLDADTHQQMDHPHLSALVGALMQEVVDAAAADGGYDIPRTFIETMLANTRKMGPYLPSMQIDRRLGRAIEVEAIHGDVVRAAQRAGCAVPRIESLYQQLRWIEDQCRD